ncbi:MAG TPA: hypothetical protein VL360_01195 [Gammaproteobacteria bacterium]|nr:hypothetical protein [Gammaproteobacteria bacterium]
MINRQSKTAIINANRSRLYLNFANFSGDEQAAVTFVQDFCNNHDVRCESYGHGYGELIVDGKSHDITPYGIDLTMMLEFCGRNPSDFAKQESSSTAAIAKSGGSPIMSNAKARVVNINDFLTAAADGDINTVKKYIEQNPTGSQDGEIQEPFKIAVQLASLHDNLRSQHVLFLLKNKLDMAEQIKLGQRRF